MAKDIKESWLDELLAVLEQDAKDEVQMDELVTRLKACSVRQLIVAMRLMRPDKDTISFDYSKVKKDELVARAIDMASSMSPDKRDRATRMMEKAFEWKGGDISGKASALGGGRVEGGKSDKVSPDGTPGAYGRSTEEQHGPAQGGHGVPEGPRMTPEQVNEAIEKALQKAMEGKTDELMDRLSKSVFKIEVESPDGDGDQDGEGEGEDESGEDGDGEKPDGEGEAGSDEDSVQVSGEGDGEEGKAGDKKSKGKGKGKGKKTRNIPADRPRHKVFQEVCQAVNKGLNVLLVGPAGCGKTHMAQDIAGVLDLSFKFTGAVSSEYKLLGFMTAQGNLVRTEYREAYENGGLFLWDELDASSAQALLSFNAGLSNGHQDFPDMVVKQHPKFRAVASANTYGNGADRMYIGRNQLDAASLDRFYVVNMDYDETLERALYGSDEWVIYVQKARKAMRELGGIRHVISMRAIQMGLKMKDTGVSRTQIEQSCLWRHLQQDDIEKIKRAMK